MLPGKGYHTQKDLCNPKLKNRSLSVHPEESAIGHRTSDFSLGLEVSLISCFSEYKIKISLAMSLELYCFQSKLNTCYFIWIAIKDSWLVFLTEREREEKREREGERDSTNI